jgi:hypothetical protein
MKKTRSFFLAITLCVLFAIPEVHAQSSTAPSGAGTALDPYLIATLNNLYWIVDQVESSSNTFVGKYFKQTADINASTTSTWFSNQGWLPIGNQTTSFKGTYDGDSHVVSNMYINRTLPRYLGLFGVIDAASIKNLGVTSVSITGGNLTSAGALVGLLISSTIDNCYSSGTVTAYKDVGGLIGGSGSPNISISNSYSACTVSATTTGYVGGFIGQGSGTGTITYCYATGSVTTTQDAAGGFAGFGSVNFSKCFSTGSVNGNNRMYFGGFVGSLNGNASDCYATGAVISTGNNVGGFAGKVSNYLTNCYSTGAVSGSANIGGLVGVGYVAGVTSCYWDKQTSGQLLSPGGGVAKTTIEMKTLSTFIDWDFATEPVWYFSSTYNNGYPILAWLAYAVEAPATQASAIVFSSIQTTQMTIGWTNGNGAKRAVFVKEGTGAITNPTDNTSYTASADWTSKGTELGTSGYYCVYNSSSNTVTITGLTAATEYTVQIFEYNGPVLGEKYNVTTATNNPKSQTSNSLIKYVDASKANDTGNGLSWATAKKNLQAAIDLCVSGDQIWVKAGTYKPTSAYDLTNTSRYYHFRMVNGVKMYGGFAGTETDTIQRVNYGLGEINQTILSGDLSGDDNNAVSPWTGVSENCYHIFYHPSGLGLTSISKLDGFIIKAGNADGADAVTYSGAAMYNNDNSPSISYCTFIYNSSNSRGGAVYQVNNSIGSFSYCNFTSNKTVTTDGGAVNVNSVGSTTIDNCIFDGNKALASGMDGGAIYHSGNGLLTITNSVFKNNVAYEGGALRLRSVASLKNCLIYENNATSNGGGGIRIGGTVTLTNVTVANNSATLGNGGGILLTTGGSVQLVNSIIWGNTAPLGNQIYFGSSVASAVNRTCFANETNDIAGTNIPTPTSSINSNPVFVNPLSYDFRIYGSSGCVDTGESTLNSLTTDIRGTGFGRKLLKTDATQAGPIDMGAYEYKNGFDPASSCENAITVTNNNSSGAGLLQQALLDICEDGTITLSLAVNWPANLTLTKNFTLDLHGFSVSNTGNYTALIDVGKAVGIKNTSSKYLFNVKIAFAATTSTLALYSEDVLGSGFSVSATSTASGLLQIGDGTTAITHTYTTSDPKFNSKISKIVVKNNSNLILNPPFDKK